jgi:hypothetical protein
MRTANCKKDVCVRFFVEIDCEDGRETEEIGNSDVDVNENQAESRKLSLTAFGNPLSDVCGDLANLSSDNEIALKLFELKDIFITYNCSTMIVSSILTDK